jgi:predicted  nucleic acid-binding Zn-ribbon protein
MSLAKRVFELQQLELAVQSKCKLLEEINLHIRYNEAFENASAELLAAEKSQTDVEKQYKDLDWEAEELRGHIKQIDDKLYGGKIKNPKELLGFEQEAGMLKANLRKKDDVLLDLMEKIEAGKTSFRTLRDKLAVAEKNWQKEKDELAVQAEETKKELSGLEKKCEDTLSMLDKATLSTYEGIKGRKGMAVVKVEQGRCLGCRVTLSVSELQRVRGEAVVICSNCGRILYLS